MNLKNILPVWGVLVLLFAASTEVYSLSLLDHQMSLREPPLKETVHSAMPVMTSMFQVVH